MKSTTVRAVKATTPPPAPDFTPDRQAAVQESPKRPEPFDFDPEPDHLAQLLLWIEAAREIVDQVQSLAGYDTDFKTVLKTADIRFALDWDASEGLCYLIQHLMATVAQRTAAYAQRVGAA